MLLLDLRVLFNNIVMAVQTFFHWWNTGMIGIGNIGVAVLALNLLDAAMYRVAEGNRLFRSESANRPYPKNINEACGCQ